MSCPCKKEECIKEWNDYVEDCEKNNIGIDDYDQGGYKLTHCENEGCHMIYWKGKNGETCDECLIEFCEGCACDTALGDEEDDDVWICSECK